MTAPQPQQVNGSEIANRFDRNGYVFPDSCRRQAVTCLTMP